MKLLCVDCDEAMSLVEARGPDEGSMTVVFDCGTCGKQTAMLTNAMETQVVRSLGVNIGGQPASHEPMEMVRGNLNDQRDEMDDPPKPQPTDEPREKGESDAACPFTDMVEEAFAAQEEQLTWTAAAEKRLEKIPSMARPMARRGIEDFARENGYAEIDESVMDAVKGQFSI